MVALRACSLSKFTDYTDLRDAVDKQGGRAANQKNLDKKEQTGTT